MFILILFLSFIQAEPKPLATSPWKEEVFKKSSELEEKMIAWRRDIHQNPELGEVENRTAKLIADHLKNLGMEVKTGIAKTGVVGVLRGDSLHPAIALRADMDALPVKELTDVKFASKAKGKYNGAEVDVMHACGHDTHMAMLMSTAELLADIKKQNKLHGTVMFIFQPAEEGPGDGRMVEKIDWGAKQMLKEGVFSKILKPDAVLGLHVSAAHEAGYIFHKSGPATASYDDFYITVKGKQTHASTPWMGVDPLLAGAKIVDSLNHIVSRRLNIAKDTSIVTVGTFHAGMRTNIIPDKAELTGTIRSYDEEARKLAIKYTIEAAEHSAKTVGADAETKIHNGYDVTINNQQLTDLMLPSYTEAAEGKLIPGYKIGGAEDFSYFANEVPGLFLFLGVTPKKNVGKAAANHSGLFYVEESALKVGVRALSLMTLDFFDKKQELKK